jgi:hypothetical protein
MFFFFVLCHRVLPFLTTPQGKDFQEKLWIETMEEMEKYTTLAI